ncbi:hypothetical protein T439DRAFT_348947 [Meredithblackwellia eburnea MCA 4105]
MIPSRSGPSLVFILYLSLLTSALLLLVTIVRPPPRQAATSNYKFYRPSRPQQGTPLTLEVNGTTPKALWNFDSDFSSSKTFWEEEWSRGQWGDGVPQSFTWLVPDRTSGTADDLQPMALLTSSQAQSCLESKWLLLVGDSSTRNFYSALVEMLVNDEAALNKMDGMPRWNKTAIGCQGHLPMSYWKVNCEAQLKGLNIWEKARKVEDDGYFRDIKIGSTRITFIFKSFSGSTPIILPQLLLSSSSPASAPSLVWVQTGAWDKYKGHQLPKTLLSLSKFVDGLKEMYHGPIVWASLQACQKPWRKYTRDFNKAAAKMAEEKGLVVFDREVVTGRDDKQWMKLGYNKCEGWHTWEEVVLTQVQGFLRGVCAPTPEWTSGN